LADETVFPEYTLHTTSGGGGVATYLPGRDFETRATQDPVRTTLELQLIPSLRPFSTGNVVGVLRTTGILGVPNTNVFAETPPDEQWLNGSFGVVRLRGGAP
jgi:hypothetical protein